VEQARANWNDDRLDRFAEQVDKRFDRVEERIDAQGAHFDARFNHLEERFEKRFDALQQSMILSLAGIIAAFGSLFVAFNV
jgi:flagellar capping protein FliD